MGTLPTVLGVTVDDPTSVDRDDAIWLETSDTGYVLTVSVTAVSRRIKAGSPPDSIAQERAFSRYYASHTKHMLTKAMVESVSLMPRKSRTVLAMTLRYSLRGDLLAASDPFLATLDHQGAYGYEAVADLVAGAKGPHAAMFKAAATLSERLLDLRRQSGALVFYDLMRGWETTEEGFIRRTDSHEANIGHIIIQEFMVAGGVAMGQFASVNKIDVLFRNHQAGFAAPERDQLLGDLTQALSMPLENLQTLRARFMLILERANVGPWLLGHYGLNVPAYVQWTSPIRRYSDLVNHRQVLAFLGEGASYSREELSAIAEVVNAAEEEIRDAGLPKPAYGGATDPASVDFAAKDRLRTLAPDKFHEVLMIAAKAGQFPPALLEELDQRFEDGLLGPRESFALLLVAPASPALDPLRHRMLDQLARVPVSAPSIMSMAANTLGYSVVRFTQAKEGPAHQPLFTITARVTVPDLGNLDSAAFNSMVSKIASQRSVVDLIGTVAGYRPQGLPDEAASKAPAAAGAGGDWKSALNQLCQRQAWGAPEYDDVERTGPPHAPLITCSVTVLTNEGPRSAVGETAGSKKQAEQFAARVLYGELSGEAPEEEPVAGEVFIATVIDGNYISALGETCIRRRWLEPKYYFEQKRDVFTCTCVVVPPEQSPLPGIARSGNKAEAKRQAARRVYLALLAAAN